MTEQVTRELELEATPEELWKLITSDGWLADEVDLELTPGGEARFRTGTRDRSGWIEDVSAPGRLAFWWSEAGNESASRVELTLTWHEGVTRIRIVEARPLDSLNLVGLPLPGSGGPGYGPALVAA